MNLNLSEFRPVTKIKTKRGRPKKIKFTFDELSQEVGYPKIESELIEIPEVDKVTEFIRKAYKDNIKAQIEIIKIVRFCKKAITISEKKAIYLAFGVYNDLKGGKLQ